MMGREDMHRMYLGAVEIARRHRAAQAAQRNAKRKPVELTPKREREIVAKIAELKARRPQTGAVKATITRLKRVLNPEWGR